MVESAAEASEELMNKYLEEGDLSEDDIKVGFTRTFGDQPMMWHWRSKQRRTSCWTRFCDFAIAGGRESDRGVKTTVSNHHP